VTAADLKPYVIVQPELSKDFTKPLSIASTSSVRLCASIYKRYILLVLVVQMNTRSFVIN